jgi:tetratricopeptide (TPR) repeat protein
VSVSAPERKTLSLEPLPAEMKADIFMARGQYAAAIAAYQEGNLKSAIVWNSIGMAYHHMFALEEARKAYQTALAINPRFAAASNIRRRVRSSSAILAPRILPSRNTSKV